jgi:hypothetical protein
MKRALERHDQHSAAAIVIASSGVASPFLDMYKDSEVAPPGRVKPLF